MAQYREELTIEKVNLAIWGKAFKYLAKYWPLVILIIGCMAFTSFYDASFVPTTSASLIGAFKNNAGLVDGIQSIWDITLTPKILGITIELSFASFLITYIVMILLRSVAIFGTFFIMSYFQMIIMVNLRRDAFKKIQELSFSYFDKTSSGWLIARLQNDTSTVGEVMSYSLLSIFWIVFDVIFTLITMFTISWQLSLIILATTPIVGLIIFFFETRILKLHRIARNAYSYFVGWLAECISGNKTIKVMSIEDRMKKECGDVTEDIRVKRYKANCFSAFFQPSISIISAITTALIILVGPMLLMDPEGVVEISILVLFIGFVGQIYNPIQNSAEIISDLMASQASVEKIFSLIEERPTLVDSAKVIETYGGLFDNKVENFPKFKGKIEFRNVSFSYNKGIEIIHNLNLTIEKGTTVAIVGETGCGKSTTVNLLCRFYDPTSGEVLIDDVDYKLRSVGWIRSNIGYVQQNPFIFKGTLYDNVRYGKLDATNEEIVKVCKMLNLDEFINTLPQKYDTFLRDGGEELSLGQKQLISFARAIIRNPHLLILDEATSSIDTETEHEIQGAINSITKGRTSLIIAHRLSTIINSDRIIVMSEGKIVEDGNHVTLMNKKGRYYKLYMNQFKEMNISSQIDTYSEQIRKQKIKI